MQNGDYLEFTYKKSRMIGSYIREENKEPYVLRKNKKYRLSEIIVIRKMG